MTNLAACHHACRNTASPPAGAADSRLDRTDGRRNSRNRIAVTAREPVETLLRPQAPPIRAITAALRPPTGASPTAKSP
jgi:hypothetical protein